MVNHRKEGLSCLCTVEGGTLLVAVAIVLLFVVGCGVRIEPVPVRVGEPPAEGPPPSGSLFRSWGAPVPERLSRLLRSVKNLHE